MDLLAAFFLFFEEKKKRRRHISAAYLTNLKKYLFRYFFVFWPRPIFYYLCWPALAHFWKDCWEDFWAVQH